jgi:hypothetical protein
MAERRWPERWSNAPKGFRWTRRDAVTLAVLIAVAIVVEKTYPGGWQALSDDMRNWAESIGKTP